MTTEPNDIANDSAADQPIPYAIAESFRMTGNLPALYAAKAKARLGFDVLVKDRTVTVRPQNSPEYTFDYATLGAVRKSVDKALAENGLDLWHFVCTARDGEREIHTLLTHADGGLVESVVVLPRSKQTREGEKELTTQELGSAITYWSRYTATAMLGITADHDDDGNKADGNEVVHSKAKGPQRTPPSPAPKAEPKAPPAVAQAPQPPVPSVTAPVVAGMNAAMANFAQEQAQVQTGKVSEETILAIRSLCVQLSIGAAKANILCDEVIGKPRPEFTQADAEKFLHHLQEMQLSAKGAA